MTRMVQLSIVVAYLLLALLVGVVSYRLSERTAEDYYLASRTIGTVVLLFTMFATLLSAFTFFGGPDTAYAFGPEWILVMGLMDGILFGLLWYVIGYKQWLLGQHHGYVTLGEMLGDRFHSRGVRVLVAGVSLFWLFPYLVLQQIGAGGALAALTNGGLPFWVGATLLTVFMILYVVLAGMRGVAWTDTLQGALMLCMVWAAFLWILLSVDGGIAPINDGLATDAPEVLVLLLFVPAFLLGAWAKGLGLHADIGAGQSILPVILAEYTPAWFAALVVAGAIAAMMSSADSMLLSGSSYFTRDVYRPLIEGSISPQREDWLGRAGVAVFALLALVASIWIEGIGAFGADTVGSLLVAIGDFAFGGFAQLSLPVLVALYWRRTTRWGFLGGVLISQVIYVAFNFSPATAILGLPLFETAYYGWGISLYCMLAGLVITIAGSVLTGRSPDEEPDSFAVEHLVN
jgi:SSS family solute:Na+ symporter